MREATLQSRITDRCLAAKKEATQAYAGKGQCASLLEPSKDSQSGRRLAFRRRCTVSPLAHQVPWWPRNGLLQQPASIRLGHVSALRHQGAGELAQSRWVGRGRTWGPSRMWARAHALEEVRNDGQSRIIPKVCAQGPELDEHVSTCSGVGEEANFASLEVLNDSSRLAPKLRTRIPRRNSIKLHRFVVDV